MLVNGVYTNKCPYKYKADLVLWASKRFLKPRSLYTKLTLKQLKAMWYAEATKRK